MLHTSLERHINTHKHTDTDTDTDTNTDTDTHSIALSETVFAFDLLAPSTNLVSIAKHYISACVQAAEVPFQHPTIYRLHLTAYFS